MESYSVVEQVLESFHTKCHLHFHSENSTNIGVGVMLKN